MSAVARGLLTVLEQGTTSFDEALLGLQERGMTLLESVEPAVRQILGDVRHGGDLMVRRYAERMEGRAPTRLLDRYFDGEGALRRLPREVVQELKGVVGRLQRFAQRQREPELRYEDGGVLLGQRLRPVRRAAILAPPGKVGAALGVLRAGVPARAAGVPDLLLAAAEPNDLTLAAAHLIGVTALVQVGGAQAVGALAYGTETIPRVDVIAGDGGLYAACAKRLVFGYVQVDGLGGPPEVLALADSSARAPLVAADLLAVAELEEDALPLVIATDPRILSAIQQELGRQIQGLPRRVTAMTSLERHGKAFLVRQREQLLTVAEQLAFAWVALHVERPEDALDRLRSLGEATWGVLTSGWAGAGGLLPGGGTARFWGNSSVSVFLTRTTLARTSPGALRAQADGQALLARAEGREGQARAVELRLGLPEAREK
ncbi:MAG: histidinol dehydrogenase [Myxococcales bacterium]|nr:histidinol dehydrogenase [Polyangiaceae bacterium]MDW8248799.1 histidinol dehydrogenase [Myxococcales bacterium]